MHVVIVLGKCYAVQKLQIKRAHNPTNQGLFKETKSNITRFTWEPRL